jgi:hypothetical protein
LDALVPAALGDTVSQKKCAWKFCTDGVKLSASHSITIDCPAIAIDRMLMHFTPGRESQARARAVEAGTVDEPPTVLAEDRVVDGVDPSGGNVMPDCASSPPHEARTSIDTTTIDETDQRRSRRRVPAVACASTSSRYFVGGLTVGIGRATRLPPTRSRPSRYHPVFAQVMAATSENR